MSKEGRQETIVTVKREDLVLAMTQVATATPRMRAAEAFLTVKNGELTIGRAGTSVTISVEGNACFEAPITGLQLLRARRLLPTDDPLEIAFDGESIRFGSFHYRAKGSRSEQRTSPTDEMERNRRLKQAATVLLPYGVNLQDLEELCEAEPTMDAQQSQPLTNRIAAAWAQLYAFGVDTEDLEYLVSQKLRSAWKR